MASRGGSKWDVSGGDSAGPPSQFSAGPPAQAGYIPHAQASGSGKTYTGTVKSYNAKGFGFILCPLLQGDIYFAKEAIAAEQRTFNLAGEIVDFEIVHIGGRPQAQFVRQQGAPHPTRGSAFSQFPPQGYQPPGMAMQMNQQVGGARPSGFSTTPPAGPAGYQPPSMPGRPAGFSMTPPNQGAPGMGMMPQVGQMPRPGQGTLVMLPGGGIGWRPHGAPPNMPPVRLTAQGTVAPADGGPMGAAKAFQPPRRALSPHAGSRAMAMAMRAEKGPGEPAAEKKQSEKSSSRSSSKSSSSSDRKKKKRKRSKSKDKKKKKKRRKKSESSSASSSSDSDDNGASASKAEGESSNPEIAAAKKDALDKLQELRKVEPKEKRMKEWRSLLRSWHPDKNPDKSEVATEVFQFLQKGKQLLGLDS
eukprot:TRINITY_DN554_c1_g1_i1.p1 TRINITY_DN554_c1_g1~~TRINITY_DN554_c1_g1_i1.p1  ORF type:complete len:417 (+),score=100.20 TRINITY_DN554_c1_g1_i1:98-1348(+)